MTSVRQLRAFQAVMLAGTQTRAAEKLRLTQPAVSSLIDSLEAEVGFKLFERVKGRLNPTREASYFFDYVSGALAQLANLDQVAKEIKESNAGALRIAGNPSTSLGFLPQVVARFQHKHPDVDIVLSTFSSPKVVELLNSQQYDIGVAEAPIGQPHVEVERFRLRCVCVMPVGHALAARPYLRPEDFHDKPFISIHKGHMVNARLTELWGVAGVLPKLAIETQFFWTAAVFVREGCGIAVVDPLTAMEFVGRGLTAVALQPDVFVEMGIIFPSGRPKSLPTLKFAQFVREHLARVLHNMRSTFITDPGPLMEMSDPDSN